MKQSSKASEENESPGPDSFTGEVYQIFKDIIPTFKLSEKTEKKQLLTHLEGQHYPDTKTHKDNTKIENYRPVSLINIYAKILHKILTNQTIRRH